jgi:hypothetical protein
VAGDLRVLDTLLILKTSDLDFPPLNGVERGGGEADELDDELGHDILLRPELAI